MSKRINTKCAFCRKRYAHAGAYENHIRTAHADLDIILASGIHRPASSVGQTQCDKDDRGNNYIHKAGRSSQYYAEHTHPRGLVDSDYESDEHSMGMDLNDFQDSDAEEIVVGRRDVQTNEIYTGAGSCVADISGFSAYIDGLIDNPWAPFASPHDFKLASWFIQSKVPKSRIDEYFKSGLDVTHSTSFKSAHTLENLLNTLDPHGSFLQWHEGTREDRQHSTCFFYRNIVDCVRYLIGQIAYKDSMVYSPVKEYDSEGARVYTEMHTGQWWWEMQVSSIH